MDAEDALRDEQHEQQHELIHPVTGFLDLERVKEKKDLTAKQLAAVGKIEERLRKMDQMRTEREKIESKDDTLTDGQTHRLSVISRRLEELESEVALAQESLKQALGLTTGGGRSVSKRVLDHFDTALEDDDDEFFDRTQQAKKESGTRQAKKAEGAGKPAVKTEQTLAEEVASLTSAQSKLQEEVAQYKAEEQRATEQGLDPLEAFMAKNRALLAKQKRQEAEAKLRSTSSELKDAERLLRIARRGQEHLAADKKEPDKSGAVDTAVPTPSAAPPKPQPAKPKAPPSAAIPKEPAVAKEELKQPPPTDESMADEEFGPQLLPETAKADRTPLVEVTAGGLERIYTRGTKRREETGASSGPAAKKRVIGPTMPPASRDVTASNGDEGRPEQVDAQDESAGGLWVPPTEQQGDGRTNLNVRLGY